MAPFHSPGYSRSSMSKVTDLEDEHDAGGHHLGPVAAAHAVPGQNRAPVLALLGAGMVAAALAPERSHAVLALAHLA